MKMNNIEWKKSNIDYDKLNQITHAKLSQSEAGKTNKGIKHSEEIKKIWSEKKLGHKRNKDSVKKSIEGTKETKWLQLLEKYPKKDILNSIKKNGNHQSNICTELGCGLITIRKLCKHYNIIIPKKSNSERASYAKIIQSKSILVWKCSKREPYKKVGKPKEYYSVTFCCNSFEPKLQKANMLRNLKNATPYRDMFFEYKQ